MMLIKITAITFCLLVFCCKQNENNKIKSIKKIEKINIELDNNKKEYNLDFDSANKYLPFIKRGINVYAESLYSSYNNDIIFIPLYYKDKYSKDIYDKIYNSITDTIIKSIEQSRYLLSDSILKKHLLVNDLKKLLLIDKNQNVVDTLTRIQYELYDEIIDGYFIASYTKTNNYHKESEYNVISMDSLNLEDLRKSPKVISNKKFTSKLIKDNNFNSDYNYSNFHFKHNKDTISLIAFGDYKNKKECQYLLKNGAPTDSIINDYYLSNLTPIPLATATEFTYISFNQVPESDVNWTSLIAIDVEGFKFIFYDKNRMER